MSEECDTRRVGVVLAVYGTPPSNWTQTPRSEPYTSGIERLAAGVRQRGGYQITEVGYDELAHPTVGEAVERAIGRGARRVIVVPTMFILDDFSAEAHVQRKLAALQEQHPQAEIVYGRPSFDYERQVDMILNKVREYDKVALLSVADEGELAWLNALAPGDVGMVHELRGGRGFVSRLAALGFTTGAEVRMLQNFGHGPLIVSIRDTRIALGRKEASKVRVTHRSAGS